MNEFLQVEEGQERSFSAASQFAAAVGNAISHRRERDGIAMGDSKEVREGWKGRMRYTNAGRISHQAHEARPSSVGRQIERVFYAVQR